VKELIERLLYEEESTTLDFKEEQYAFENGTKYHKCELLKDILAFSNAWRKEDSYILIGVKEVQGGKSTVIGISDEEKLDDAKLQQHINQKVNKPIHFEYKHISIENKTIGVIKIPLKNNIRPFYTTNNCEHVKKNDVKIRRGSATETATPDEIIDMSKDTLSVNNNPILNLEFANNLRKESLGDTLKLESEYWNIRDENDIPDYVESHDYKEFDFLRGTTNSHYYREVVKYYISEKLYKGISFSLYNDSNVLATDINIEIELDGNIVNLLKEKDLPEYPQSSYNYLNHDNINRLNKIEIQPDILVEKRNDIWYIELLFKKIQPKQRIYSRDTISLAVIGEAVLNYKIYADNLSEPIIESLNIEHSIKKKDMTYDDVLDYDNEIQEKEYEKMKKEIKE
jgi:hypothetical protein